MEFLDGSWKKIYNSWHILDLSREKEEKKKNLIKNITYIRLIFIASFFFFLSLNSQMKRLQEIENKRETDHNLFEIDHNFIIIFLKNK